MCLAPCFKGCTDEAYAAEVARVQAYFDSGGQSLVTEMETERERLSAALDFEAAGQQHTKIAKVKNILAGADEICRRLDQLDAVIIQPSSGSHAKAVALFRFRRGELAGPELFPLEADDASPSLESRVRSALEQFQPAGAHSALQFMEELAILKRWYYRSHKVGEVVLADDRGSLSARKIANAAERVLQRAKPEKTTEDTKEHEGITPEAGS